MCLDRYGRIERTTKCICFGLYFLEREKKIKSLVKYFKKAFILCKGEEIAKVMIIDLCADLK